MAQSTNTPLKCIPLGRPFFDQEEAEATMKIFDRQWVLDGPEVRKFEDEFKNYCGTTHAASVSNCTTGMHIALNAFGIADGDEVLMPAFNFAADGLSVIQARCKPVFVEVDPETGNLDPDDLPNRLTPKTKAILVLHYAGFPAKMDAIMAFAKKHNLKVIEDAAHALGASHQGKKIGNIGDATAFSFGPLKMICSGMGGMVTSNDEAFNAKLISLRSYGMDKSMYNRQTSKTPWSYSVSELGHNFRMSDFQAAIGIVQLKKLERFIAVRRQWAERYTQAIKDLEYVQFFKPVDGADPVPLYFVIKIAKKDEPDLRDKFATALKEQGIGVSVHWDPALHMHPLYSKYGYKAGDFPKTEVLARQIISLPLGPAMTADDVDYITDRIRRFFKS